MNQKDTPFTAAAYIIASAMRLSGKHDAASLDMLRREWHASGASRAVPFNTYVKSITHAVKR